MHPRLQDLCRQESPIGSRHPQRPKIWRESDAAGIYRIEDGRVVHFLSTPAHRNRPLFTPRWEKETSLFLFDTRFGDTISLENYQSDFGISKEINYAGPASSNTFPNSSNLQF